MSNSKKKVAVKIIKIQNCTSIKEHFILELKDNIAANLNVFLPVFVMFFISRIGFNTVNNVLLDLF